MKKFYLLILTAVFLSFSLATEAQVTVYSSITSNPTSLTFEDNSFWTTGTAPGASCDNCKIIINADVTITGAHTFTDGSTLIVEGPNTVNVNNVLVFDNSNWIVGSSDGSTGALVYLNDQAQLSGTSYIQLANNASSIDVNNDNGGDGPRNPTVHGTYYPIGLGPGDIPSPVSGIYSIISPTDHSDVLVPTTFSNGTVSNPFSQYTINCDNAGSDPDLSSCADGVIYGPATTAEDPDGLGRGIIFAGSPILPVVIVQFVGSKNPDGTVKLSWATAQEINSASFDVERSNDQGSWEKIGSVAAKGYASTTSNYSYTDKAPLAGTGYYRLKMIDLDAKYQYSKTVAISNDNNSQALVVYSNPFSDAIRVKVNVNRAQNLSLVVSDITGKTYLKQSYNAQAGDNLIDLVPAGAASGMYVLHIEGSTYNQTVKLAKQ